VRDFRDEAGSPWVASIRERGGDDYKGRFCFHFSPDGGPEADGVSLGDIRWNSAKTAQRTLATMSEVELRKRLKTALGRTLSS